MTREPVDQDALIAYMRQPGALAINAAKEFNISRVRVGQILKEKAPELLPARDKPLATRVKPAARRAMIEKTQKALTTSQTKEEAARKLKLTVSGLNWRIRRLGLEDPLKLSDRTEALKGETMHALNTAKSKPAAAKALGIEVTSLTSRIQRYGLNDPFAADG